MKKPLLTFLLGVSLIFGANQLKGQEEYACDCLLNRLSDDHCYKRLCLLGENDGSQVGMTGVYYYDSLNDTDDFYEITKLFDYESTDKTLTLEEFYLDKETGNMEYSVQKYKAEIYQIRDIEKVTSMFQADSLRKELGSPYYRKYYPTLTAQDISALGGERFTKRLTNIVNAGKNEIEIKKILKAERWGTYK